MKILKLPYVKLLNWEKSKSEEDDSIFKYFLYDITKDGIPELWLIEGRGSNTTTTIYTIKGNDVKKINEHSGHNATYYKGEDYVILENSGMGYINRYKIVYNNNVIDEELVYEYKNSVDDEGDLVESENEYEEIKATTVIEFHSSDDFEPILDALPLD